MLEIGIRSRSRSRSRPMGVPGWLGTDHSSRRFALRFHALLGLFFVSLWLCVRKTNITLLGRSVGAHRIYGGWRRLWLTRPTTILPV